MEFVRTASSVSFYTSFLTESCNLALFVLFPPVFVERLSSRLFVRAFVRRGARTESQIGNFRDSLRLVWELASHELCIPTEARGRERERETRDIQREAQTISGSIRRNSDSVR